jgi:hypothetical protein
MHPHSTRVSKRPRTFTPSPEPTGPPAQKRARISIKYPTEAGHRVSLLRHQAQFGNDLTPGSAIASEDDLLLRSVHSEPAPEISTYRPLLVNLSASPSAATHAVGRFVEEEELTESDFAVGDDATTPVTPPIHDAAHHCHDIHAERSCCRDAGVSDTAFASALAASVEAACAANLSPDLSTVPDTYHVFFSDCPASALSIPDYVARFTASLPCRPSLIVAQVLIARLQRESPALALCHANARRIFMAAATVADKYLSDQPSRQSFYAHVGGADSVKDVNNLEVELLKTIRFDVHVSESEFALTKARINCAAMSAITD